MNDKLKVILSEIGFKEKESKWIEDKDFRWKKYFHKEYVFVATLDNKKVGKLFLGKDKKYLLSHKYNTSDLLDEEQKINLMIKDLFKVFYKELRKYKIANLVE